MLIQPQGSRLLVELIPYENDTLVLTSNYKEVQQQAKVVKVGHGTIYEGGKVVKPDFKVGDKVIVTQTGGTMIEEGGKKYQLLAVEDAVCLVEEDTQPITTKRGL